MIIQLLLSLPEPNPLNMLVKIERKKEMKRKKEKKSIQNRKSPEKVNV